MLTRSTGLLSEPLERPAPWITGIRGRSANSSMARPAFTVRVHTADVLMVGKAVSGI